MGMKNQKALFISAFAIIAVTVLGIVALNFTVEKISKMTPAFAMAETPPPQQRVKNDAGMGMGMGDPSMQKDRRKKRPEGRGPDMQSFRPMPGGAQPPQPPKGAQRKARGGQDFPIERSPEPPPQQMPPQQMYQPPPGYPSYEDQMRMQEDLEDGYYPDGPYPPPYDYDDPYYPDYENDYGYDPQGALDRGKDSKVTKNSFDPIKEGYLEPDREMIDDYLNELYDEAELP